MALTPEAKEAKKAYHKKWRDENRNRLNEYYRAWRKSNPEKVQKHQENYWNRKAREMDI